MHAIYTYTCSREIYTFLTTDICRPYTYALYHIIKWLMYIISHLSVYSAFCALHCPFITETMPSLLTTGVRENSGL